MPSMHLLGESQLPVCPPPLGVLFSVEVTSSHFALTHYLPCFFSAACGALTFRLFSVWSGDAGAISTRPLGVMEGGGEDLPAKQTN